ncbi:hypothetical protein KSP39_PZI020762 [Platanthera zijinensis]|uniref:Uncharacterized protein n=1 Tax=Platanthera zijinensis TaxID=2320716 RepID=A0AAP0B021_9ASPA
MTKLINHNERLTNELALLKNSPQRKLINGQRLVRGNSTGKKHPNANNNNINNERVTALQSALMDKERIEVELQKKVEESKQREASLENELSNMWTVMEKLKKSQGTRRADLEDG